MQISRRSNKNVTSELTYACMEAHKCSQIVFRSHRGPGKKWPPNYSPYNIWHVSSIARLTQTFLLTACPCRCKLSRPHMEPLDFNPSCTVKGELPAWESLTAQLCTVANCATFIIGLAYAKCYSVTSGWAKQAGQIKIESKAFLWWSAAVYDWRVWNKQKYHRSECVF